MWRVRPTRFGGALAGLALALAWAACGEAGGEATAARRDSAGIEIVENVARDRPLRWSPRALASLGGADEGPASFYEVSPGQVAAGRSGELYVLDESLGRVVVFDSLGRHLRSLGRKGGGPGELERPWYVSVGPGDTVWVFDFSKRGFVRFAPEGVPADLVRLGDFPYFGGRVEVTDLGVVLPESGMMDRTEELVALGATDTLRLASLTLPEAKEIRFESCPMRFTGLPPLFHPSLVWAARGSRVLVSAQAAYVLDVWERDEKVASVRRDLPLRPVTEEMAVAEVGDGMRVRVEGREITCDAREAATQRGWAAVMPAVESLALAPDGRVWVRRGAVRGEPATIDVLAPDGEYLGTLPEGTPWPAAFLSPRTYAAIETDELDVDHVVIYRIEETSG